MRTKYKSAALSLAIFAAVLTSSGCNSQPNHPNQINTFDGASYDSMTLAHGALSSLRVSLPSAYAQYGAAFNQAAATYSTAFEAYTVYRTAANASNQAQVAVAVSNLTLSIVILEDAFQTDMHVNSASAAMIRAKGARIRALAGPNVSVADILTELEIAASIAKMVPAAQPYAALAAVVIAATDQALSDESAAAGQPIDLSTIQPIASIQ